MYYPATLDPHDDGSGRYDVTFADLPGCVSQGENLDDALRMAREALSLHVGSMLDDGDDIPAPSTLEEARAMDERTAAEDAYTLNPGTIWQYVSFEPVRKGQKVAPVKLTISVKPSVIVQIDAIAEEMGLTRSGAIAVATREYASRIRS